MSTTENKQKNTERKDGRRKRQEIFCKENRLATKHSNSFLQCSVPWLGKTGPNGFKIQQIPYMMKISKFCNNKHTTAVHISLWVITTLWIGNKTPIKVDKSTLEQALPTDSGKCPQYFHCTPQSLGFHSNNEYFRSTLWRTVACKAETRYVLFAVPLLLVV